MKKWFNRFLKSLTWTLCSWMTTFIVVSICTQDSEFTLMYACMIASLLAAISLGKIPVYMAHEWVWGPEWVTEDKE